MGVGGHEHVRDLWRQRDLPDTTGAYGEVFKVTVAAHGVELYKFTKVE
ncbi:MAG: hypothetical protein ACREDS_08995 [Limisphaerales bacterium]